MASLRFPNPLRPPLDHSSSLPSHSHSFSHLGSHLHPLSHSSPVPLSEATALLVRYLPDLTSRSTDSRHKSASEFRFCLERSIWSLSPSLSFTLLSEVTEKVIDLVQSDDPLFILGGLALIEELLELRVDLEVLIVRFSTAFRLLFHRKLTPEPNILEKAAKALGKMAKVGLAQGGGAAYYASTFNSEEEKRNGSISGTDYATERSIAAAVERDSASNGGLNAVGLTLTEDLVEYEINEAFEWLSNSCYSDRHLTAVLVLKELAENTPALFNVHVQRFLETIWTALHSPRVEVREAAIVALRACLADMQRRSSPWKQQCYDQLTAAAVSTCQNKKSALYAIHGSLMVLGELLGVSSDFLLPRYDAICEVILQYQDSAHPLILRTVISLIPRLAAIDHKRFVSRGFLSGCLHYILLQINSANSECAYLALGQLALSIGDDITSCEDITLSLLLQTIAEGLIISAPERSSHYPLFPLINRKVQRKVRAAPSSAALMCCGMMSRALGSRLQPHLPHLLNLMFDTGLSTTLVEALTVISQYARPLLHDIQVRLLELIAHILSTGVAEIYRKGAALSLSLQPHDIRLPHMAASHSSLSDFVTSTALSPHGMTLALRTLATFDLSNQDIHVLALLRDLVSCYLSIDSPLIRREACLTMTQCLASIAVHARDGPKGQLLFELLRRLVVVAIADPLPAIRLAILSSLDSRLDVFLAHTDCLQALFVALNDEISTIRELTVILLGRLSERHPSLIQSTLRRTLIALLSSIEQVRDESVDQEESSRLLSQLIASCPSLVKPYVSPILRVLVPKLNASVGVHALTTLGALSTIGGNFVLAHIDGLLPLIVLTLQDKTSHARRQAALLALAQILSSTGYVLSHNSKHTRLLSSVLKQLQVERQASVRLEVLKVLGIIGALDPLKYKELMQLDRGSDGHPSNTSVNSSDATVAHDMKKHMHSHHSQHVHIHGQLPLAATHRHDKRAVHSSVGAPTSTSSNNAHLLDHFSDAAAELASSAKYKIADEGDGLSAHEEYFPIIAVAALLRVLTDFRLAQHHHMVIKAMMFIYQTLGSKAAAVFLPYVLPALFTQIQQGEPAMREAFFQHLSGIVRIVHSAFAPYAYEAIQLSLLHWSDLSVVPSILTLLESVATAVGSEFNVHLNQLVPRLVSLLAEHADNQFLLLRTLTALQNMCSKNSYSATLHVLLPSLVRLCELDNLSDEARVASLETISQIAETHSVNDHASRLVHPFARFLAVADIHSPAAEPVMRVMSSIVQQMGTSFLVFEPMITAIINKRRDERLRSMSSPAVRNASHNASTSSSPATLQPVDGRETLRYRMVVARLLDSIHATSFATSLQSSDLDAQQDLYDLRTHAATTVTLDKNLRFDMEETDGSSTPGTSQNEKKAAEVLVSVKKLPVNQHNLLRSWTASQRSSNDDWAVWMRGLSIEMLKESPSSSLRACAALAQKYPPLARELFNAAFLSCWTELYASYRSGLIQSLEMAFKARTVPSEIVQILLNLAEFMDHHDQPLPIDIATLGNLAERCHAFAKALHYKEAEFLLKPSLTVESLIGINNKLQQYDAASGVLKIAEREHWPIKVAWYEKLQRWEEALEAYQRKDAEHIERRKQAKLGKIVVEQEDMIPHQSKKQHFKHSRSLPSAPLRSVKAFADYEKESKSQEDTSWQQDYDLSTNLLQNACLSDGDDSYNGIRVNGFSCKSSARSTKHANLTIRTALSSPTNGVQALFNNICSVDPAVGAVLQPQSPLSPTSLELRLGRMRCLRALGEHDRLLEASALLWKQTDDIRTQQMIAPLACSACCGLRQWSALSQFLTPFDDSVATFDSLFYSAVLRVHHNDSVGALKLIDRCCESLDASLTALVGESYQRAYRSIVKLQQCMELAEVLRYKEALATQQTDRADNIRKAWRARLNGCQRDVDVWQEVLMIRSLVIPPNEDANTYLEFSSLCRKQGKMHLSLKTITSLLGVSPLIYVEQPQVELATEQPNVTLAAIKHIYASGYPQQAYARLQELVQSTAFSAIVPSAQLQSYSPHTAPLSLSHFELDLHHRQYSPSIIRSPDIISHQAPGTPLTPCSDGGVSAWPPTSNNSSQYPSPSSVKRVPSTESLSRHDVELSHLLSRCYLKLGQWQLEMIDMSVDKQQERDGNNRSSPTTDRAHITQQSIGNIMEAFELATRYDQDSYKAWHEWSMMNFRVVSLSTAPSHQSLIDYNSYVVPAIRGFFRSLFLIGSSAELGHQDVLRILQLWFEHGHRRDVELAVLSGINTNSVDTWLAVIPQLIARIHTPSSPIRNLLTELLCRIGKSHPQALVYPLTVASKSPSEARRIAALHVLNSMRQHSAQLISQASLVSSELVRVAILWHELWHEAIEEASKHWFVHHNVDAMMATLGPLHALMDKGPRTARELQFHQLYHRELQEAYEWLKCYVKSPMNTRRDRDMEKAWALYSTVFKKMDKQNANMTSLELSEVSPKLMQARDLQLAVPGSYRVNAPVTRIASFSPTLRVIESKQHPRRLSMMGDNGREYMFLLKGHEDLRQDQRCMQLFGLVNAMLAADRFTAKYELSIRRYEVVPLSPGSGLIEWVPHCDPLHHVIKQYRDARNIPLNLEQRLIVDKAPQYALLTLLQKVEVFQYALSRTNGTDLAKVLWLKSPNAEIWLDRRTNLTRSLAVMSMVGYILGLGDRHTCNLMLDRDSGEIVHIDFGDCFEVAQHRDKFPERVPFRLTRMLVATMEVSGIEGSFRFVCERVMNVLRSNKNSVMALLEAFIYDPLINWRLVDHKRTVHTGKDARQSGTNSRLSGSVVSTNGDSESLLGTAVVKPHNPLPPPPHLRQTDLEEFKTRPEPLVELGGVQEGADFIHDANNSPGQASQILDRRRSIVEESKLAEVTGAAGVQREHLNEKALTVIARVESKLKGTDHGDQPMDVPQQVRLLIEEATSSHNLCQLYVGFCAWW